MRKSHKRNFPMEINDLRNHTGKAMTPMALLHHELSAENAVIPFSLSLPASHLSGQPCPFQMEFSPR
ncbi:hypothetical protein TX23_09590 [Pseudomonas paralactis]|uniref:Uncharacterized protein n=1 Tax=Pseudomonas paralactis TaxID=1615673 RepID=A0A0R3AJ63_9PSED|nr:hypothetical protein [Pseudomonas paralactis]KRP73007.1 hypothetical protein TX23_09590 [Pseudomonas paralactis]